MKGRLLILSALLWSNTCLFAGLFDPMNWIKTQVEPTKSIYFAVGQEDKQQLLNKLKEERSELEQQQQHFDETIKASLEKVSSQIILIKDRLKEINDPFLQKKLSILNENHQSLIDLQLSRKEIISILDQQIKVLDEYLKDPEFKTIVLDSQPFYSFEHLQHVTQKMAGLEDSLAHLEEQRGITTAELENKKRTSEQVIKLYRDKEREQKDLGSKNDTFLPEDETNFDLKQRAELIDQNLRFLVNKKRLIEEKIVELKRKLALIDSKIFVTKEQRSILDQLRATVKEGLKVEESDINVQRAELEKKKQTYIETKESYYHQRKNLSVERDRLRQEIETFAKRLEITVGELRDLDEMAIEPSKPEGYIALGALLNIKEQIFLLEKKIELLDAEINLEETKFDRESVATEILDSWHKITMRKFRSEEHVETEIKKYQDPILLCERELATYSEKRNNATNFLAIQNKVLDNIKARIKNLDESRSHLFKNYLMEFYKSRSLFVASLRLVNEQIEENRKIIEVYSNVINLRSNMVKQINTIVGELNSIGPRAPNALSWEGIRNIPADLELFVSEIINLTVSFVKQCAPLKLVKKIQDVGFGSIISFIFRLLFLFLLFFFLKAVLPLVARRLLKVQSDVSGVFYIARLSSGIISFSLRYFGSIFIWCICYIAIHLDIISDIYPQIIFYIVSIPFLIFLANKFFTYFVLFNEDQDYIFFSQAAYEWLATIAMVIVYSTIAVFFFREAFMLAIYSKSDLPTILLAVYSIIVRIMLISLIRKEDILELIPTEGPLWQWVREIVEEHFYSLFAFLAVLIIMSEPHIGYGKYVSYLLWGLLGTFVLVRGLMLMNLLVKRASTVLFFSSEGDHRRERFPHARTAYGFFVMTAFGVFAIGTVLIGARIWGYTITFSDISDLMHMRIFEIGEGTTDRHEINALSLLYIVGYVLASFFIASFINHFILRRIFDLLMVEQGVQYTISIIMQYLIVIMFILIGFHQMGLKIIVYSLAVPLLLGIGWAVKEYANDFVAYFIILVQRPFKIGDWVKLEGDVYGNVRKITPRTVIVRSKNSVTILIPNSKVVNDKIVNWNYSRSFCAFNDITISVPFSVDPAEVKTIISRVLDANMHILKNPRPIIWLNDFGEQGFVFLVRGFLSTDNVSIKDEVASDVRFAITKALKDHGIGLVAPATLIRKIE